jgi:hypothetical protein
MNSTPEISELASALVEARKKFSPALKHAKNPAFGSKYVDLATAVEATDTALSESGLTVIQSPHGSTVEQTVTITTRLLHKSGQWLEGELTLPVKGQRGYDAQAVGSAITYGRRYAYMAMLGIAPEDDDGNAASQPDRSEQPSIQRKSEKAQVGITQNGEPIFDEDGDMVVQRAATLAVSTAPNFIAPSNGKHVGIPRGKRFFAIAMGAGRSKAEINDYLGTLGCEKSEEIPVSQYEAACAWAAGQ